MRVLITGADGFLGKSCVRHFKAGGFTVITADKSGLMDYKGDLCEIEYVSSLPDVDIVVNCAAVQYVTKNKPLFNRASFFQRNNIATIRNLHDRFNGKISHFIHIGTSMMYEQSGAARYDEGSVMRGQGIYSTTKIAAQEVVSQFSNLNSTVVPCIIGGVGREGLFTGFVNSLRKYRWAIVPGCGCNKISLVHVDDVAALTLLIAKIRAPGLFNAAAEDSLTIDEWVEVIAKKLALSGVKILHLPLAPIEFVSKLAGYRLLAKEQLLMLHMPHVLDIQAGLNIGWSPKHDCVNIINDIVDHVTFRGD